MNALTIAIGIGLAVSLLFSELFGLAAGGMVVPGYFALSLNHPLTCVATILVAFLAYAVVHSLSLVVIVYGKRRTVLMILVAFLLGILAEAVALPITISPDEVTSVAELPLADFQVIGYIIPGLLAIWIDRQGLVETVSVLITASVVVRLVLILVGVEGVA